MTWASLQVILKDSLLVITSAVIVLSLPLLVTLITLSSIQDLLVEMLLSPTLAGWLAG